MRRSGHSVDSDHCDPERWGRSYSRCLFDSAQCGAESKDPAGNGSELYKLQRESASTAKSDVLRLRTARCQIKGVLHRQHSTMPDQMVHEPLSAKISLSRCWTSIFESSTAAIIQTIAFASCTDFLSTCRLQPFTSSRLWRRFNLYCIEFNLWRHIFQT